MTQPPSEGPSDLSAVHLPPDAEKRLRRMRSGEGTQLFTSDLSVNEFLLVREAGFRPVGLVLGSSVYHVGLQVARWGRNMEMDRLTQAMYHARELAMTRMEAEAHELGADGIVGVRLEIDFKEFGNDLAEFIAIGTAVVADEPPPADGGAVRGATTAACPSRPTSPARTSGPWSRPATRRSAWSWARASTTSRTAAAGNDRCRRRHERRDRAVHRGALRRARARHEPDAGRSRGPARRGHRRRAAAPLPHRWGGHTTEFFAIGTAVRPLREDHVIATPQLVLPLTDGWSR